MLRSRVLALRAMGMGKVKSQQKLVEEEEVIEEGKEYVEKKAERAAALQKKYEPPFLKIRGDEYQVYGNCELSSGFVPPAFLGEPSPAPIGEERTYLLLETGTMFQGQPTPLLAEAVPKNRQDTLTVECFGEGVPSVPKFQVHNGRFFKKSKRTFSYKYYNFPGAMLTIKCLKVDKAAAGSTLIQEKIVSFYFIVGILFQLDVAAYPRTMISREQRVSSLINKLKRCVHTSMLQRKARLFKLRIILSKAKGQEVPAHYTSLNTYYVYVLDCVEEVYVWLGKRTQMASKQAAIPWIKSVKALDALTNNRSGMEAVRVLDTVREGAEPPRFWILLGSKGEISDEGLRGELALPAELPSPRPATDDIDTARVKVAVIGAGVCGAVCAQTLSLFNFDVTVFEQGPDVGGRLAIENVTKRGKVPSTVIDQFGSPSLSTGCPFVSFTSDLGKKIALKTIAAGQLQMFRPYLGQIDHTGEFTPFPHDTPAPPVIMCVVCKLEIESVVETMPCCRAYMCERCTSIYWGWEANRTPTRICPLCHRKLHFTYNYTSDDEEEYRHLREGSGAAGGGSVMRSDSSLGPPISSIGDDFSSSDEEGGRARDARSIVGMSSDEKFNEFALEIGEEDDVPRETNGEILIVEKTTAEPIAKLRLRLAPTLGEKFSRKYFSDPKSGISAWSDRGYHWRQTHSQRSGLHGHGNNLNWLIGTSPIGPAALAAELLKSGEIEVRRRSKVVKVQRETGTGFYKVDIERAGQGVTSLPLKFNFVLLCMPAPQAARLTKDLVPNLSVLAKAVRYLPIWVVAVTFNIKLPTLFDAVFVDGFPPLVFAAREGMRVKQKHLEKPLAIDSDPDARDTWVLHADAEWSKVHRKDKEDDVAQVLLENFRLSAGLSPVISRVAENGNIFDYSNSNIPPPEKYGGKIIFARLWEYGHVPESLSVIMSKKAAELSSSHFRSGNTVFDSGNGNAPSPPKSSHEQPPPLSPIRPSPTLVPPAVPSISRSPSIPHSLPPPLARSPSLTFGLAPVAPPDIHPPSPSKFDSREASKLKSLKTFASSRSAKGPTEFDTSQYFSLLDDGYQIGMAGDWCVDGSADGAVVSGHSLAMKIVELQSQAIGNKMLIRMGDSKAKNKTMGEEEELRERRWRRLQVQMRRDVVISRVLIQWRFFMELVAITPTVKRFADKLFRPVRIRRTFRTWWRYVVTVRRRFLFTYFAEWREHTELRPRPSQQGKHVPVYKTETVPPPLPEGEDEGEDDGAMSTSGMSERTVKTWKYGERANEKIRLKLRSRFHRELQQKFSQVQIF